MPLPPAGDIAIVVVGALVAGFVNGLTGTGYALMALGLAGIGMAARRRRAG